MIPVNTVYNTVLMLLEKNAQGMIEPTKFNLFSQLAQQDILENLFFEYNNWLNRLNKRLSGDGNADISANILEQVEVFSEYTTPSNFTYNPTTNLYTYTGTDFYRLIGLSLVNAQSKKTDIEIVSKSELNLSINSSTNAPSITFPIAEKIGNSYKIYPKIVSPYTAEMAYIRTPRSPKWTYINVNGNPVYNPSASDKQDFELLPSLYSKLVMKILLYCGLSLREADIVNVANTEEQKENQQQS
jgi:hypothetical protein